MYANPTFQVRCNGATEIRSAGEATRKRPLGNDETVLHPPAREGQAPVRSHQGQSGSRSLPVRRFRPGPGGSWRSGANFITVLRLSLTSRPNEQEGLPLETLSSQVLDCASKVQINALAYLASSSVKMRKFL
jgi:hypothetical protein